MIPSKEDILEKHNWSSEYPNSGFDPKQEIFEAMDEYAKEIAIGFAKWLDERKINADKEFNVPKYATTEQLFQQYIKTLQP